MSNLKKNSWDFSLPPFFIFLSDAFRRKKPIWKKNKPFWSRKSRKKSVFVIHLGVYGAWRGSSTSGAILPSPETAEHYFCLQNVPQGPADVLGGVTMFRDPRISGKKPVKKKISGFAGFVL